MVAVLLDKYTPGAEALVPGADNSEAVNAALVSIAGQFRDGTTAVGISGTITHDRTVTLARAKGIRLVPRKPGDGFQTLTDTGGLEPRKARTRAHVSIDQCEDSGICDELDIGGTHPETGPNSSPDVPRAEAEPGDPIRDIWEGQAGVRVVGSTGTVVCANVHHVWGDFVETQHHAPRPDVYAGNVDTVIYGGTWHRNGRVGVKLAANKGLRWYGTKVSKCVGEKFHIESGSDPRGDQSELWAQAITLDGFGRSLVGASGGNRVDGLYVGGILLVGGCLQLNIAGPARSLLGLGSAKYTRFRFWGLHWNEPESGGVVASFSNIDGLDYVQCSGPVRKVVQERLQFRTKSCRQAVVDLSGITRV